MTRSIEDFARETVTEYAQRAAAYISEVAESSDEESVHKLRVSIRRLQQSLRLFPQFLVEEHIGRVKDSARTVFRAAAEVRNRDISIALFRKLDAGPDLTSRLELERIEKLAALQALACELMETARTWPELLVAPEPEEQASEA